MCLVYLTFLYKDRNLREYFSKEKNIENNILKKVNAPKQSTSQLHLQQLINNSPKV
ncbi:hypothetical protein SAMN05661096_01984 [Marivirga sericea]|uniref:Uncharacterized protein n=1 Tax=Marivirga sericea TaxID=1028 RepID=A0A1X7JRA7_9BACT|nr:hypothetical protein SAMN05661096_01984 [Marivirga sericea]